MRVPLSLQRCRSHKVRHACCHIHDLSSAALLVISAQGAVKAGPVANTDRCYRVPLNTLSNLVTHVRTGGGRNSQMRGQHNRP
jgi:hypothetical protein